MDALATYLQPAFMIFTQAAVVLASGLAISYAQKHWGLTVNQSLVADVDRQITHAVGVEYAQADAGIDAAVLSVKDDRVRSAANAVLTTLPDKLTKLGLTPDMVAKMVLSRFGQFQSSASTPTQKAV